ncbi:MAG: hypothetical protein QOD94_3091, partial [Alphaproteobacteria bacterium]|nr:hypothetical protein [Alphaproteobacteria bacterium]
AAVSKDEARFVASWFETRSHSASRLWLRSSP